MGGFCPGGILLSGILSEGYCPGDIVLISYGYQDTIDNTLEIKHNLENHLTKCCQLVSD